MSAPLQAQKTFATPQQASEALIQATETFDLPALKEILGPAGEDLVSSEDPVQDKNIAAAFATKAQEKNQITLDPKNSGRAILSVGSDDWPLPIPLVKKEESGISTPKRAARKYFSDASAATKLDAIKFAGVTWKRNANMPWRSDNAEVNQFAQRIISTPGKHDGRAWRNTDGTLGGPSLRG